MTTFFAGDQLTAAQLEMIYNPPVCQVVQQSAQTGWTTGTPTAVTFGSSSTVKDTDAIHSESVNTSRLVIGKKLGIWEVSGVYVPAGSGTMTTLIRAIIYKNGSFVPGSFVGFPTSFTTALNGIPTAVIEVEATASTDYVELMGYQTSAGTVGTAINTYAACSLKATWLRPS